jgi:HEAT repeat protein
MCLGKRLILLAAALLPSVLPVSNGGAGEPLPGIVFVSDDIFGPKHLNPGQARPATSHWRDGYIYHRATTQHPLERTTTPTRPGRHLYTLVPAEPGGTLTRLTHLNDGELFDPEPSWDGTKILFSMRRDGEDWYNLYEIGADGRGLRQLTDGPFNDVSGVYLPDGQIVFVSDRGGYLEEYHEERTEALWTMRGDGSGIRQLTFNPGTVFDPTVLADGRILYSLWDVFMLNIPATDKHETYLMTIRPDGTEEGHFFGIRQYRFFDRERHSGVALTQAGQMPDGTVLVQSEMGPSILDPSRGLGPREALWPVFPGTTSVQLGGATHRVHLSPTGSRSTPYPLPDGRFLFSGTLPGARDIGIYITDPKTRQTELVFNDPLTAEYDARPIFLSRPRPKTLPPKAKVRAARSADNRVAVTGRARFVVVAARRSDDPYRAAALKRARYFRVVEALYTAVTTSSHSSLATRVLGAVPILPDGSVYYEAPADTPLFLEPLDAAGRRIQFDWHDPVTSVPVGSKQIMMETTYVTSKPGEVKSCHGCHAPLDEAASQPVVGAALAHPPVQVERDLTDLLYRRNEPDEYRCVGRLGEAPKYLPWLAGPDADLRRRACELLAEIEDGARESTAAIAGLLSDESSQVRRAAALALARLGAVDAAAALIDALTDADWQVRFAASTALEAVTACVPETHVSEESTRKFYVKLLADAGGVDGLTRAIGAGPDALVALGQPNDPDLKRRWLEAAGRLGASAPEPARRLVRGELSIPLPPEVDFEPWEGKRHELQGQPPELSAIRAAGWMGDVASVQFLAPWLSRPEYQDHATEAALALGRIGTPQAVETLWVELRRQVPDRKPFMNRYLQFGPRPEEYAMLRGLILARAKPAMDDVHLIVALAPGSFLEKPRYEDRARPESQRVLLGRLLLEEAGLRSRAVELLVDVLRDDRAPDEEAPEKQPPIEEPLYQQILKGINLERPFAEHRRPFPVVERIEPEQALWLLGCLTLDRTEADRPEVPESLVRPYLASENWRERIDAAVLLGRLGFGAASAEALAVEAAKPYPFPEIMGIGKSHYDTNFRDKSYMVMALARGVKDVDSLRTFADPKIRYRDVRYGLAVGLGRRGKPDGIDLLVELASGDPVMSVRREARQSLRAIQETLRMAGREAPKIELPEAAPFEACWPPRGLHWPAPVVEHGERTPAIAGDRPLAELRQMVADGLKAEHYRDLNNANNQAPGATRMMVEGIDPFDRAVAALAGRYDGRDEPAFYSLIDSPYPVAHYLAMHHLAPQADAKLGALLIKKLETYAQAADTVGFFWTCEAIARRGDRAAIGPLAEYAQPVSPAGIYGPVGMGLGYPAAKALARLAGQISHPEVQRLLADDNIWLRSGALRGLTEAEAPGIAAFLNDVLRQNVAGLVRAEAEVGLSVLANGELPARQETPVVGGSPERPFAPQSP